MPVLLAVKPLSYAKVKYRVGDLFECDNRFVPLMIHAGLARLPETKLAESVPVYQTRHLEAQKPATVAQLRLEAEARGIHLPKGYIPKEKLRDIIAKAS